MGRIPHNLRNESVQTICSLINTALGREKADIVIEHANLVNVDSGEVVENSDVAIKNYRVAITGRANQTIGNDTFVINGTGKYLVPGFLDGHVHVESAMVTLVEFARAILPHGTTGVFIDPHEIANVLGLKGFKLMLTETKKLPLKVFVTIPSCVPSAPNFETTGAEITLDDIKQALTWDEIVGLGEVMDFPGVLRCDTEILAKIQATLKAGKIVEGHADSLLGKNLAAYVSAGISSCHESTRTEDAVQRLRFGMYAMIREGSASRDLSKVVKCITRLGLDSRHALLVTDDTDPGTLISLGHIDHVVRRAIEEGTDPLVAVQMATINTAEHFGLSNILGSIAPGKIADLLILDDVQKIKVKTVIANGKIVAKDGKMLVDLPTPRYPSYVRNSMRLKRRLNAEDFEIKVQKADERVTVNVIGVQEGTIVTRRLQEMLEVQQGRIKVDVERDIAKIAVVERHKLTGNVGLGFVNGMSIRKGAIVSSVAHDSHNIIVIGENDHDMKTAVNAIADIGGGFAIVDNGKVISLLPLPIAGLMSEEPVEKLNEQIRELKKAIAVLGCSNPSLMMTMSFLALPVIPAIRITDRGLVDTHRFCFINLIVQ